jgi:invasion protein IalB
LQRNAHWNNGQLGSGGRLAPVKAGLGALCAALLLVAQGEALAQDSGQNAPGIQFGADAPAATPELETREYQDWTVRCSKGTATVPAACEMLQQPKDDQGQTILAVAIGKLANTPNPGMLIILPLGIWLPPGVVLKVDDGEEIPARVERCERRGCQVELLLEPDILAKLKAGTKAEVLFQIYDENGEPQVVGVSFSLFGFTAALNEVMA